MCECELWEHLLPCVSSVKVSTLLCRSIGFCRCLFMLCAVPFAVLYFCFGCILVQGRAQTLERCLSESKAKEQRSREIVASLKHSYRYCGACLSHRFACMFVAWLPLNASVFQQRSQSPAMRPLEHNPADEPIRTITQTTCVTRRGYEISMPQRIMRSFLGATSLLQQGARAIFRFAGAVALCYSGAQAKITGLESELESTRKSLAEARRELAESRRDAKVRCASRWCEHRPLVCCTLRQRSTGLRFVGTL